MNENMQQYLDKAQVLIEALPYIQRFNRKIIVVKYGGSAMIDEDLKRQVIQDVTLLKLVGFKPIIVHGGGKEISKWVGKVGMEPQFINGLRVTDEDTMEIAEMVLGKVNKSLVQLVEELGVRAIGISGKDGGLLKVDKKLSDGKDIGFVGDVKEVNADILFDLLEKDFLPIVCPVGMDDAEYRDGGIGGRKSGGKHSNGDGTDAKYRDRGSGGSRRTGNTGGRTGIRAGRNSGILQHRCFRR